MSSPDRPEGPSAVLANGEAPVSLHLDADMVDALQAAARDRDFTPTLAGSVRGVLREWLREKGYLRQAAEDEGIRPQNLNSENDG